MADVLHPLEVEREHLARNRTEHGAHGLSDHLLGGVAGHRECRLIDRQQPPFHVVSADQPLTALDQMAIALFAFGEARLRVVKVRDIDGDAADQVPSVGTREGEPHDLPLSGDGALERHWGAALERAIRSRAPARRASGPYQRDSAGSHAPASRPSTSAARTPKSSSMAGLMYR